MAIDTRSRHRTKVGGNVFMDLGFPPKEAKRLLAHADAQIDESIRLKQQLMDEIAEWMKEASVTQAAAAEVLHVTRPRVSEIEYVESDDFRISDLLAGLKFQNGELHLDTDYLRGRRLKTRVVIRQDGTGTLETIGRGKAALHWIARLKGQKPLRAVD